MAQKKESRLQRKIRKHLEKTVGGFWFKSHGGPFQMAGLPDLIGCVQGYYIAFEIKTEDGVISPRQETVIKMIKKKGGGLADVVTTPEEAEEKVKEWLDA